MNFQHVASGRVRRYLMADTSTSLDVAGRMIDRAQEALNEDRHNTEILPETIEAREAAIYRAESYLGERNSVGVRRALRDFWNN